MTPIDQQPFKALIAGGGVGGLEAALALRYLARGRVSTTLLTPETEFVYRPLRVREPFAGAPAGQYALEEIAHDIGVELISDAFKRVDPDRQVVHTQDGEQLSYDALLLALGARPHPQFEHALTLDDRDLDEQLHGVIQDVETGYAHKLAFISPSQMPWPLPLYELALMTAGRARDMNVDVSITIVTPEDAPLALFGEEASQVVERLLEENGILVISATHAETPEPGQIRLHPDGRTLYVDRILALPELVGPSPAGAPANDHGFIPIDDHCRVSGLERVFAAGDATDFPVKHGGIAAQQADVAAASMSALAGVPIQPPKFHPVIQAMLLGGRHPLYLSAHITGGHGRSSRVSQTPAWFPNTKIVAQYLAPYLESRERAAVR